MNGRLLNLIAPNARRVALHANDVTLRGGTKFLGEIHYLTFT